MCAWKQFATSTDGLCPMYASSILRISYTVISLWHLAVLAISGSGVVMSPNVKTNFLFLFSMRFLLTVCKPMIFGAHPFVSSRWNDTFAIVWCLSVSSNFLVFICLLSLSILSYSNILMSHIFPWNISITLHDTFKMSCYRHEWKREVDKMRNPLEVTLCPDFGAHPIEQNVWS